MNDEKIKSIPSEIEKNNIKFEKQFDTDSKTTGDELKNNLELRAIPPDLNTKVQPF